MQPVSRQKETGQNSGQGMARAALDEVVDGDAVTVEITPPELGFAVAIVCGVLLTAQLPTRAMERDAAAVGLWENDYTGRKHPRLQIITLAELFTGKRPDIPWVDTSVAKSAKREDTGKQGSLL